jgi:hypothetical protein
MRRISAGQRQRQRTLAPLHRPAEGLLSRVPPLLASAHSLRERRWLGLGRPRRLRASATAVPGRPTGVFTGLSWSLHVRHRGLSVPRRELHPPARPSLYGHALRALLFALDLTPLRGRAVDYAAQVRLHLRGFRGVSRSPVAVYDHGVLPTRVHRALASAQTRAKTRFPVREARPSQLFTGNASKTAAGAHQRHKNMTGTL